MNKGVIETVSKALNKKNEPFFKLEIAGRTYNAHSGSKAFEALEVDVVQVGDLVEFEFTESNYTFQGKPAVSKNLVHLVKVGKSPIVDVPVGSVNVGDEKAYREYQMDLMGECIDDATNLLNRVEDDTEPVLVAIAFFEKRCKPFYYFEQEGK